MGLFILAIIFALIALPLFIVGKVSWTDAYDKNKTNSFPLWSIGVVAGLVAVLCFLLSSIKTVGAREVGIPVTLGKIGTDLQPGVHFLAPWTTVHSCTLAQQQSIQTQAATSGDQAGNDGIPFAGSDQGSGTADTTVLYHFDPAHANEIYRKYGCQATLVKQNLIRQALKGAVPAATAQYQSLDIKNNRPKIQSDIESTLNQDFQGDGIVVDSVILSQIDLSQATQQAADAKLAAQQAAQQAQFNLQKAQVDKQTALVEADAQKAANESKSVSLTPQILCSQWIDALKTGHITVVNTAGPCSSVQSTSASSVIVNAGG